MRVSWTRPLRIFKARPAGRKILLPQLTRQPRAREFPIAHDCLGRNVEGIGRLLDAETAKKSELDHVRSTRIHSSQRFERIIERAQLCRSIRSARWQLTEPCRHRARPRQYDPQFHRRVASDGAERQALTIVDLPATEQQRACVACDGLLRRRTRVTADPSARHRRENHRAPG